ncbi:MAG: ribosome maturation factor RimM [Thermodesulfobacteriota bacterium]|jgi:ribosomal 30S subunit maturation factor RimM|nr:MAG: hypothetical protein EVA31_01290 [Candidatus Dadabacteria bacterium]|tara:strand:+ start:285 stop:788 length:504 start_codon:yes stop_codon:yes gene_type:complete
MSFLFVGTLKRVVNSKNDFRLLSSFFDYLNINQMKNIYFECYGEKIPLNFELLESSDKTILIQISDSQILELETSEEFKIYTEQKYLPKLDKNEYLNNDLLNCQAISEEGESFGKVSRVLSSNNSTLIEILYNEKSYIVPFNDSFIIKIDISGKSIIIKNLAELSSL